MMDHTSEEDGLTTHESVANISQTFSPFPQPPALPITSLIVGFVIGITGICANAVALMVVVFYTYIRTYKFNSDMKHIYREACTHIPFLYMVILLKPYVLMSLFL